MISISSKSKMQAWNIWPLKSHRTIQNSEKTWQVNLFIFLRAGGKKGSWILQVGHTHKRIWPCQLLLLFLQGCLTYNFFW